MAHLNPDERARYILEPLEEDAPPPPKASIRWDLLAGVVVVVALVGWLGVRSMSNQSESIHRIHNHAAAFDGRQVVLRGTVGDVFDLGSSTTYLLRQGGDTIVVFTRGRAPQSGSTVTIHGSVSVGYLDGAPRTALFESPSDH